MSFWCERRPHVHSIIVFLSQCNQSTLFEYLFYALQCTHHSSMPGSFAWISLDSSTKICFEHSDARIMIIPFEFNFATIVWFLTGPMDRVLMYRNIRELTDALGVWIVDIYRHFFERTHNGPWYIDNTIWTLIKFYEMSGVLTENNLICLGATS